MLFDIVALRQRCGKTTSKEETTSFLKLKKKKKLDVRTVQETLQLPEMRIGYFVMACWET